MASVYEDPNRLGRWLQVTAVKRRASMSDTRQTSPASLNPPAELRLTRDGPVLGTPARADEMTCPVLATKGRAPGPASSLPECSRSGHTRTHSPKAPGF